jgi:hypothetical protein
VDGTGIARIAGGRSPRRTGADAQGDSRVRTAQSGGAPGASVARSVVRRHRRPLVRAGTARPILTRTGTRLPRHPLSSTGSIGGSPRTVSNLPRLHHRPSKAARAKRP